MRDAFANCWLLIWTRWLTLQKGLIHKTVIYITGCHGLCHTVVTGHVTRYVCDWSLSGRNRHCGYNFGDKYDVEVELVIRTACGTNHNKDTPGTEYLWKKFWFNFSSPFSCSYRNTCYFCRDILKYLYTVQCDGDDVLFNI